jgi:hypothetical protein
MATKTSARVSWFVIASKAMNHGLSAAKQVLSIVGVRFQILRYALRKRSKVTVPMKVPVYFIKAVVVSDDMSEILEINISRPGKKLYAYPSPVAWPICQVPVETILFTICNSYLASGPTSIG